MSSQVSEEAREAARRPVPAPAKTPEPTPREPLWRDLVGAVLRRERRAQRRTLREVADAARISLPYLSEIERGRKEASSEVLAAAAHALGLGLGDLLSLVHGELAHPEPSRRPAPHHRPAAAPHRSRLPRLSNGGLCLAA
ncbi:helix-turn-helix domain-containing protein [Streptomyces sp. NPDC014991]|uniref:helix-turn-helix domain-containing protein n=1 Tax=Streptomyces sp. NPDC014991 TaxID=3364935 RepID=UPI0036F4FF4A